MDANAENVSKPTQPETKAPQEREAIQENIIVHFCGGQKYVRYEDYAARASRPAPSKEKGT